MKKRNNGEGSWSKKYINGVEYVRFRKTYPEGRKEFYGKTKSEVNSKVKQYESMLSITSKDEVQLNSFSEYCNHWLITEKKDLIAPKTFDSYENVLNQILKDSDLGNLQVKAFNKMSSLETDKIITTLLDSTSKTSCKTYVNTLFTILSQVCKYGLKNKDFNKNFMENITKPPLSKLKPPKEKTVLDIDQVNRLWDEMLRKNTIDSFVQGKIGEYVYGLPSLVILFLCYTGMRSGEVTALKWRNVNIPERYIEIDEQVVTVKNRSENEETHYVTLTTKTKNKKKRIIPLADRAYEILQIVNQRFPGAKPDDLVFSKTGKPISNSNLNRTLRMMLKRAKLPENVTIHTLRHSFASILLNEDDQNLYAVSDMLGHSSTDVTYKVYIDIFMKNKAKAINIFNNIDNHND